MSDLLQFAPPPGHPDADQLTAFTENALPPHEREQTLAHLATCADCRQIVFLAHPPEPEELPQPIRKPLFSGWTLAFIGTGALAAGLILTVTLRNRAKPIAAPQTIANASVENLPAPSLQPQISPLPAAKPAPVPSRQVAPAPPRVTFGTPKIPAKTPFMVDGGSQVGTIGGPPDQLLPNSNRAVAPLGSTGRAVGVLGSLGQASGSGTGTSARISGGAPAHAVRIEPAPQVAAMAGMARAASGAAMAAPLPPEPASSAAPAPPPPQAAAAKAVTVDGASDVLSMDAASNSSATVLSNDTSLLVGNLPSHLPPISTISNGARTLSLDTHGALFVSKDNGKHWDAVAAPWTGRALQVNLVPPAFQLTTETGATWISTNGKDWKRK